MAIRNILVKGDEMLNKKCRVIAADKQNRGVSLYADLNPDSM